MGEKVTMRRPNESPAMYRARIQSLELAAERARMLDRWDHKKKGTPETHEHAWKSQDGPLSRLCQDGYIDADQLQWACEIAAIAESIQRDVSVKCSSYEMKVDQTGSPNSVLAEGVMRVRREMAYSWWRDRIPHPRRAILDMLIGEMKSYSQIAAQWRMGKRRARKLLISAIDLWPVAMDYAETQVDREDLDRQHARLA